MGPDENHVRALTPSSCCGESRVTPVARLESQKLESQLGLICRLLDRTPSERSEASWSF